MKGKIEEQEMEKGEQEMGKKEQEMENKTGTGKGK